jgi:hypothetical protein
VGNPPVSDACPIEPPRQHVQVLDASEHGDLHGACLAPLLHPERCAGGPSEAKRDVPGEEGILGAVHDADHRIDEGGAAEASILFERGEEQLHGVPRLGDGGTLTVAEIHHGVARSSIRPGRPHRAHDVFIMLDHHGSLIRGMGQGPGVLSL